MDLDPLTAAITALAEHDDTCPACAESLPDFECADRVKLKAGWRRAVRAGGLAVAGGAATGKSDDAMSEDHGPRCLDCGTAYRLGEGYGDAQLFCSEPCADSYRRELGA